MKQQFIISIGREYGSGGRVSLNSLQKHWVLSFMIKI